MNKDVIYIDVEDDVTAIIGKIKASREKVIALVPPKRVGVLQSAVNLRLLDRMANSSHKHLVLITNNQALIALSAAAGIPVAKNLQSKPELAEITALNVDDDEDIIDGSNLPVGELERTTDRPKPDPVDDAIDELDIDDKKVDVASGMGSVAIRQPKKNGIKVPNFNTFRKRLFLGIAVFIVLVIFLIWANLFAPAATILVTAKTITTPVSTTVTLNGATPTDTTKGTVQTITQTLKKDNVIKFTATGSQDVGAKATGTINIENCDSSSPITIPASATFTASSGQVFNNTATVTVGGLTGSSSVCKNTGAGAGTGTANVVAPTPGTSYNIAATSYSISTVDSGAYVYANGSSMTGGTSKIATVVTASDIQKATDALNALSTDDAKKQVTKQFTNGEIVIGDSFNAAYGTPVSAPALGAEADAQATLTSSTVYTITAIPKSDVELYLKSALAKQLVGTTDQRVYDDGVSTVLFTGYSKSDTATTVNINAKGQVGPNIDTNALKTQVKGKKSGEIQSLLTNISGVSDVTVNFSYPWVTTVPNDVNKIDVQFKLTNG
ncbi:hypothetical protein EPN95_02480 [Patescibacteria group bacterium]|nr:MAG: hypothetical protein EPN95_02480 [Patescibacteria group bacterium]